MSFAFRSARRAFSSTWKGIVIAFDRRFASEHFAAAAAEVVLAHGIPVALADHAVLLSTPAVLLVAGFFYVMLFPQRVLRWKARNRLADGIRHCAAAISQIGHSSDPMHWLAHASCIGFVGAYIFIGAYVCHALDLPMPAGKAAAVSRSSSPNPARA